MKAFVYHVQVNVRDAAVSLPFYRDLLRYLEFQCVHDDPRVAGYSDGRTSVWIIETADGHAPRGFHRKAPASTTSPSASTSRTTSTASPRTSSPRARSPPSTGRPRLPRVPPGYYAVFFEDPDRLKLEIAHIPEPTHAP